MNADVVEKTAGLLRFKIDGLDCQNEVRALRAAVGPVAGGDDRLSFDTKSGLMVVSSRGAASIESIEKAVETTGMRAHLLAEPLRQPESALLFRVEGLDCKNEIAALKREVGPLVGVTPGWLSTPQRG